MGLGGAYAVLVTALYLLLSGSALGRRGAAEGGTSAAAEYVESMADLFQRGGKRSYILQHYHAAFKRRHSRRWALTRSCPTKSLCASWRAIAISTSLALLALLARLRSSRASEADLLRACRGRRVFVKRKDVRKTKRKRKG